MRSCLKLFEKYECWVDEIQLLKVVGFSLQICGKKGEHDHKGEYNYNATFKISFLIGYIQSESNMVQSRQLILPNWFVIIQNDQRSIRCNIKKLGQSSRKKIWSLDNQRRLGPEIALAYTVILIQCLSQLAPLFHNIHHKHVNIVYSKRPGILQSFTLHLNLKEISTEK